MDLHIDSTLSLLSYLWLVHTADKTVLSRLDQVSNLQLIACSHRGREKTVLSYLQLCSLVRVGDVNTIGDATKTVLTCRDGGVNITADKTRQFYLVRVGGVNKP